VVVEGNRVSVLATLAVQAVVVLLPVLVVLEQLVREMLAEMATVKMEQTGLGPVAVEPVQWGKIPHLQVKVEQVGQDLLHQ
jgi:hypothetical protein